MQKRVISFVLILAMLFGIISGCTPSHNHGEHTDPTEQTKPTEATDPTEPGVVEPDALEKISISFDNSKEISLPVGSTAQGAVTGTTTQLKTLSQDDFDGIYFSISDDSVAYVDAKTGAVTGVGEGKAVITSYVQYSDKVFTDTATITVTDSTALAAIAIESSVDYVTEGHFLQLKLSGKKASGVLADMSGYSVEWTLDEASVQNGTAILSTNGKLTGCKEGTVTVTASVKVNNTVLTSSKTFAVPANETFPGKGIYFNFLNGGILKMETATIEENGIAINRELSHNAGNGNIPDSRGWDFALPLGSSLALDFMVKKSGWYLVDADAGKTLSYYGTMSRMLVDDMFIGYLDFGAQKSGSESDMPLNTVYLEAGIHTMFFTAEEEDKHILLGNVSFLPVEDPTPITGDLQVEKTTLIVGERIEMKPVFMDSNSNFFHLHYDRKEPTYTNYYSLKVSSTNVVRMQPGDTEHQLIAAGPGTAEITLIGMIMGEPVTKTVTVTVVASSFHSASLKTDRAVVKPDAEPFPLELEIVTKTDVTNTPPEGVSVSYKSNNKDIATVSSNGMVSLTGKEGSAEIIVTLTEGERVESLTCWVTATNGKTEPTLYTYEERAIAQENAEKYDWAKAERDQVAKKADYYVEHLDQIYNMWIREGLPRSTMVGLNNEMYTHLCRYCGANLRDIGSYYPWIIDPIKNPWKITCPACSRSFPSNDFESYYKCGLDETGHFSKERALANGGEKYLVNELYPEMGKGWGVDDGWGYHTGKQDENGISIVHSYIAVYVLHLMHGLSGDRMVHSARTILETLADAYLYTGDERYGNAGAILIDRMADLYPEYDLTLQRGYSFNACDNTTGMGKIVGPTWECFDIQTFAKAADVFWPCMGNDEVISFLRGKAKLKGIAPEEITPDYVRRNIEDNILIVSAEAIKANEAYGNFGLNQTAMARVAVALDRNPESQEMIDWIFAPYSASDSTVENGYNTGGDIYRVLVDDFDRDGMNTEGSLSYTMLTVRNIIEVAEALKGYEGVESADLWEHPKFVNMFTPYIEFTVSGKNSPAIHETTGVFQIIPSYAIAFSHVLTQAFLATGNVQLAQAIYAANGNSVEGLRGDIFTKDPESGIKEQILEIIDTYGEWDMSESNMLAGFGLSILRDGPSQYVKGENEDEFFDAWINFSHTNGHCHQEMLHFELDAFGLALSGNMGYPIQMTSTSPERHQWNNHTISNNTVVVDQSTQLQNPNPGIPLHFADGGKAKVMDVNAPASYETTDIYRRTVVTVQGENGISYAVDFFRILGGSEHIYSYHGATRIDPETEGLTLVEQPFGTYAGADIPFGNLDISGDPSNGALNTGSGFSWLYNVSRDSDPEKTFYIDWEIEDYQKSLPSFKDVHMRLTMLSDEPYDEVALADGQPAQDGRAPDHVEFVLVKRSGDPGLDTLFTAVIEPYKNESQIAKSELVEIRLVSGTPGATDRAACVKVTQVGGREDFIVYATNADCTYEVLDTDGTRKFLFQGFAGVCCYEDDQLTYAWGNEISLVEDAELGAVIEDVLPKITGTVKDFTDELADTYYLTVKLDVPATVEQLEGNYIYINNDGVENGVYYIESAEIRGNTAVLNVGSQDFIRSYIDCWNMDLGYVYNIAEGQSFYIPLSASYEG